MDSISNQITKNGVEAIEQDKIHKIKEPEDWVILSIKKKTRDKLQSFKIAKRESNDEVLTRILTSYTSSGHPL